MMASDSFGMWHGDVLLSNIATLSGDCQGDSHIGIKHECHRNKEKQGQKDDVVNQFFLHKISREVWIVRVLGDWGEPGQLNQ